MEEKLSQLFLDGLRVLASRKGTIAVMKAVQDALDLIESGDVNQGFQLLKESMLVADDETKFNVAQLLQQWGFIQQAIDITLELKNKYNNDSQIILLLSECYIDMDEEEKAIDLLQSIDASDDLYLSSLLLLADLYQLQGLDEVAEQKLLNAKNKAPKEPIISFALGEFYLSTGQASKAIPMYESALHSEALTHENVELKLAEALSLNGYFEEALPYYKSGLNRGKSLDALFGYGMTAYQLEKYDIVIPVLKELKELDSHYSTLYPLLAHAYKEEGALEESLKVLKEGLSHDEYNERLLLEAGKLSIKLGEVTKGITYLEKLLKLDSENLEALTLLVEHYEELEYYEDIINLLKDFQHNDPNLNWILAKAYVEEDELQNALNSFKEAHTNFTENPSFLQQYGDCLLQLGHNTEALIRFKQALQYDLTNENLIGLIERLEFNE